jgi:hypothetical protein
MMKPASVQMKWLAGLVVLIAISLVGACAPPNQAPVISTLSPSKTSISKNDSIELKSDAIDPDGDELIYNWSASDGEISREGPVVFWTAPDALGTYTVTLEVTDGNGGRTSHSANIEVGKSG